MKKLSLIIIALAAVLFPQCKKEESNTDFSLVKGALTENINRLEKLMNNSSSKYIQVKRTKENA